MSRRATYRAPGHCPASPCAGSSPPRRAGSRPDTPRPGLAHPVTGRPTCRMNHSHGHHRRAWVRWRISRDRPQAPAHGPARTFRMRGRACMTAKPVHRTAGNFASTHLMTRCDLSAAHSGWIGTTGGAIQHLESGPISSLRTTSHINPLFRDSIIRDPAPGTTQSVFQHSHTVPRAQEWFRSPCPLL